MAFSHPVAFRASFVCIFAAVIVSGVRRGADCRNNISNCQNYNKNDICNTQKYANWAKTNCEQYCGLCERTVPCVDKTDCTQYDFKVACYKPYVSWAINNCEMTCRFCKGTPTPKATTSPPIPTPKPPTPAPPIKPKSVPETIVSLINGYRSNVQPPAAGMPKVAWDPNLATLGRKWTDQCNSGAYVPDDDYYGSTYNWGAGHLSWKNCIESWHSPVSKYQYGKDPDIYLGGNGFYKIGTYTQLVDSNMVRVGCAYNYCNGARLYICHFVKGQLTGRDKKPYDKGERCSACPNTCKNGLCDCGGLLCYGSDVLNVNTCKCE